MGSSFQVNNNGYSVCGDYGFSFSDPFIPGHVGICQNSQGGVWESLLLDGDKGELVQAPAISRKEQTKLVTKKLAALKSHSEAERRRRERINGHLATLRNFVPCTGKMDKATLLAKVINQLKVLRNQATEASKEMLIPTDFDELKVIPYNDCKKGDELFTFRASLCCEHKAELILDIRQAIDTLKLSITKAEISTLQNRLKGVLTITGSKEQIGGYNNMDKFANSIHQALLSVLNKNSALQDYPPKTRFPNKRRRFSVVDSSYVSL